MMALVIVSDFYVINMGLLPHEADAPLIVDTDTMLADPVAPKGFKPIARWGK